MAFDFYKRQILYDKRTGQGAHGLADEVAVGKSRFRRQHVDQGGDEADAHGLPVRGLGQADGDAVRGDRPVRRNAADAGRYEMKYRADGQHERRNGNPAELSALAVVKFQRGNIFYLFHTCSSLYQSMKPHVHDNATDRRHDGHDGVIPSLRPDVAHKAVLAAAEAAQLQA